MARKPSPEASDNAALKDHIRDSANHIWLAGLGAFAKAQQEGGKVFESLIKDGLHMQQQTQQVAEEKIAQATHTMSNLASQFTERAGGSWDRLETLFEQRVAKAMHRLGWPSADDVAALPDGDDRSVRPEPRRVDAHDYRRCLILLWCACLRLHDQ